MPSIQASRYIFKQAALQNQAVAKNLSEIEARSSAKRQDTSSKYIKDLSKSSSPIAETRFSIRERHAAEQIVDFGVSSRPYHRRSVFVLIFGILILIAGLVAIGFVIGPTLYKIVVNSWKTIILSLGGVCIGSGFILVFGSVGKQPLKKVVPPDSASDQPLLELEALASRTVSRLKTAYQVQVFLICTVAALLLFVVLWSIFLVSTNQLMYATAFGSSGIGMLVLSKLKWQPFERMAEARKLADDADILTAGLRLRIKSISEIADPKERAQAQWEAVSEYLERS